MKKVFLLFFAGISLYAVAQKKGSWELTAAVLAAGNNSPLHQIKKQSTPPSGNPALIILDSSGNPLQGMSFYRYVDDYRERQNKISYKTRITPGISAGVSYSYPLNNKLSIAAGVNLSIIKTTRMVENEYAKFYAYGYAVRGDSLFAGNPVTGITYVGDISSYINGIAREETFRFVTFNFPVAARYRFKKLIIEAGFSTSFIVNSTKKKATVKTDPEFTITETTFQNNQSLAFSLTVCPAYQLTDRIRLGIEFAHGITTLIDSYDYRRLVPLSAGLKLFYKL
jgi:Outer membrane protein beta-barrel domain